MDNIVVVYVLLFSILFVADSTRTKDLDLDSQLKLINKPALKSFQTEYGDIIDCVHMYKQLAFDHPLLKNHTIQLKPKSTPRRTGDYNVSSAFENLNSLNCPPGSVPIKRATMEDLKMSESLKSLRLNRRASNDVKVEGHEYAMLVYQHHNYGARTFLNVWNPVVQDNQFSLGSLSLANGPADKINTIEAGWIVHSSLNPNATTFFVFWTGDGYQTGCLNILCPGYVQVNKDITPGMAIKASTFMGNQAEMRCTIYLDLASKKWWLVIDEDKFIGYWPMELFPAMLDGAQIASWGGEVYSPATTFSPAMGSGHFPEEGYMKAAYSRQLAVVGEPGGEYGGIDYQLPKNSALKIWANKPYCYNAQHNVTTYVHVVSHFMFFGGPGDCTF